MALDFLGKGLFMETSADFLERLRARVGAGSKCTDKDLSRVLQVVPSAIHSLKHNVKAMSDETAVRMAELLDLNPGYVIACCHAERTNNVELKRVWEALAKQASDTRNSAEPLKTGII